MPTIFITGCSSGFGLETARLFHDRGWDVIATMRTPRIDLLPSSERLRILPLDVTDTRSVDAAIEAAGEIDVLVNNAGFGAAVPIELTELETARKLYETNTLGTLAVLQAVVPAFRARRAGVIINVTSSATLKPLPLVGVYRSSKAAVNAFTESLAVELKPFGIRVHIVLPGRSPETRFRDNAMPHVRGQEDADYAPLFARMFGDFDDGSAPMTHSEDVAEAVWRVATDPSAPLKTPAGADAVAWMSEAV